MNTLSVVVVVVITLLAALPAAGSPVRLASTPEALVAAMRDHPVVVLGEVHDNAAQHALRAAALRMLIEEGVRPALAFEQFDRERQPDIDRARLARPRDADYLIAQAKGGGWEWSYYRPVVQLALDHDLPIVAANLSRVDAMKVAREGYGAVLDGKLVVQRRLEALPVPFRREHEQAIATGHCGLLAQSALAAMARAQIARDLAMAEALRPHRARGVVLLAGNGHARTDVGVPHWLNADGARVAIGIGLLEAEAGADLPVAAPPYDFYLRTEPQPRPDPCKDLRARLPAMPAR